MSLNSVYHPGEAIPQQVWISWDCVECDNRCEATIEAGEILQSHMFCYRCGSMCKMPHAILVEEGEYTLEEMMADWPEMDENVPLPEDDKCNGAG